MLKRKDVPHNRKWNLKDIFSSEDDFEKLFGQVESQVEAIVKFQGTLNKKNSIECLQASTQLSLGANRLYLFAMLKRDLDTANPEAQALMGRMQLLITKLYSAIAFIDPELAAFPDSDLEEMIASPIYEDYTVTLKDLLRGKKHILSQKEEELLAKVSSFSDGFQEVFSVFDNADLKFDNIEDSNGNLVPLSHGTYSLYLESQDRVLRENAFTKYYEGYIAHQNTVGMNYISAVKKDCAYATIRNHKSALDRALFNENVERKVYDNLVESIKSNTEKMHEYVRLRKRLLGLDEMHMYDMYTPLASDFNISMEYEGAYALVIDGLGPLGKDYIEILKRAFDEGWIDVFETENKRSGAYSAGIYDVHPYVLLNYTKTTHDIFTIAHEMGHAMHSYLSSKTQCPDKADYEIFVAEVASTVNEVLLLKYLMGKVDDKGKKFLLNYYINMFRTTVFRQSMFAQFELIAHESHEKGIPLTPDYLNKQYLQLNKDYYGDGVFHDNQIAYEWLRIPHFYRAFYVYKYATGLISAVNIASKLLRDKEYVSKYMDMLSAGCSLPPVDILKIADVDLSTTHPFEMAMEEFKEAVNLLGKL